MLSNWWHDRRLRKWTIETFKRQVPRFKKHKALIMGHKSIPSRSMSSDWTTGVCWSMMLQSEFANQQDQIWTRKPTKKGMQQCECPQIFFCVWEPTSLFIKVPTPGVFNCLTVFANSLELITCSFHKLISKVLASFNNDQRCGWHQVYPWFNIWTYSCSHPNWPTTTKHAWAHPCIAAAPRNNHARSTRKLMNDDSLIQWIFRNGRGSLCVNLYTARDHWSGRLILSF